MEPFTNGGSSTNGQPIKDRSRYQTAIAELKQQILLLPGDYARGADGMSHKPPLYVMVRVIKFLLEEPRLCVDEVKRDGIPAD